MVLFSYPSITNNFFSIDIKQKSTETHFTMRLISPTINTAAIPQTFTILSKHLPSIHSSKCFNDKKLPFAKEVRHTEIGHLFEHILLEYLYQSKVAQGNNSAIVKGQTSWNWEKDPKGMFHITINTGIYDAYLFPQALKKSVTLLKKILLFDPYFRQNQYPLTKYAFY